jgi:hypothetical protein
MMNSLRQRPSRSIGQRALSCRTIFAVALTCLLGSEIALYPGIPLVAVAYAMEPAKAVVAHRACGLSMAFEGRDKNNIDQYKTGGSGTKSMAIICQYRS